MDIVKQAEDIVDVVQRTVHRNMRLLRRQIKAVKRVARRYEEPYCEVAQSEGGIMVHMSLPTEVKKEDIVIKMRPRKLEIEVEVCEKDGNKRREKSLYRMIDLPREADGKKTRALLKKGKLIVKIPLEYAKNREREV